MANFDTLKTAIVEVIKTNGNNEITGALLQQSLIAMINSLGAGYQFAGVAVPATNPGTPDQKVVYFAGPGTYPNFGPATIPDEYVGFFYGSGSTWNVATAKTSPFTAVTVANDIIQLMDGATPVYPRTRAEAVFFDNDTTKTLDKQFSQLGQESTSDLLLISSKLTRGTDYPTANYRIDTDGTLGNAGSYKHGVKEVTEGEVYILEDNYPSSSYRINYAFATGNPSGSDATIPLVAGTSVMTIPAGKKVKIIIPTGCTYLLFDSYHVTEPNYGSTLYFVNILQVIGGIKDRLDADENRIEVIENRLYKEKLSAEIIYLHNVKCLTDGTYEAFTKGIGTFAVEKGDIIDFTAGSYAGEIGFISNLNNMTDGSTVPFMPGSSLVSVAKNTTQRVVAPDNGYFFFNVSTNANRNGWFSALEHYEKIENCPVYLEECAEYKIILAGKNTTDTTQTVDFIPTTNISIPAGTKLKLIVNNVFGTALSAIKYFLNGTGHQVASQVTEIVLQENLTSFRCAVPAYLTLQSGVEVTAMLVTDDLRKIIKDNTDDIQRIKNSAMPRIGIEDLQSAAGVSGNDFTENFVIYVNNALFKTSNSIFSCTAKYTTSNVDTVPTIRFSYGNSAGTTFRQKYVIGTKDEFEEKQWRFPKMFGYDTIRVEFIIPAGVILTIKDFSVLLDNSINRNTYRFFEHSTDWKIGEFNTVGAFTYAAQMGYYGAIVVPKFTSDGVIVCYHDDSFGDNPDVEMIDGTALPTTSIQTSTYAQVCGMQYVSTNRLGEHPRIPTFEEFIKICAKTGLHPCLSCHPYLNEAQFRAIKAITDKYHITNKLTIKHTPSYGGVDYQAIIFTVFGNGIECYLPDVSTDELSAYITAFNNVNWDLDKVKVGVEFMNPTYASDSLARESGGVKDLVAAGYVWGVFQDVPTALTLRTLIDSGCYEWAISSFNSNGLNW